jgi:Putative MetA-pathway of phenol degradation
MVKFPLLPILAAFVVGAPAVTQACSICGCGDPLESAGIAPPLPGGFRFALQTEYLTATAASDEDPARTESLTQRGVSGTATYGITSSLSLVEIVPLVEKDWKLTGGGEPAESADPIGLGDVNVGARWYLFQRADYATQATRSLALSAGSTLPTGRTDEEVDGERIDQHAQPGTGAWGPYAGLVYSMGTPRTELSANASAGFHGTNDQGYRFGDAVRWGVEGKRRFGPRFAVSLAGEGRYAARDVADGEEQVNTGGTVIDLTPGAWWSPASNVGFYARVRIPVASNLSGEQTVGSTVQVGTQLLVR